MPDSSKPLFDASTHRRRLTLPVVQAEPAPTDAPSLRRPGRLGKFNVKGYFAPTVAERDDEALGKRSLFGLGYLGKAVLREEINLT